MKNNIAAQSIAGAATIWRINFFKTCVVLFILCLNVAGMAQRGAPTPLSAQERQKAAAEKAETGLIFANKCNR